MGSAKQKRRKKLARAWIEFQTQHELSDDDLKLARSTGYTIAAMQEKLSDADFAEEVSIPARIREIHRRQNEKLAARREAIASGEILPPAKKKQKKAEKHDPQWAQAKQLCQLNMDDIRKAKEMGLNPRSLIKNIPSPTQSWKTPVKYWIRDMYEERERRSASKASHGETASKQPARTTHDSIVKSWEANGKRNDEENYDFLRSLKCTEYDFEPDELAHELHEQAFDVIDCTRCANCCKTLKIRFDAADIERISQHLEMSSEHFIATYLEPGDEPGSFNTRQFPCPFLAEDNRCTIYEIRPTVCQDYPYTNKDGLVFRTMGVANSALTCPAVFWIVEEMKKHANE